MADFLLGFKNIRSDKLWIFKIAVFSIPLYIYLIDKNTIMALFLNDTYFFAALTAFYLGISAFIINRNINNKSPILPFIKDIFEVILRAIGSVIAAIPGLIIAYLLYKLLNQFISIDDKNVLSILRYCTMILMFPFICVPIVIFNARGKFLDLVRNPKIYVDCGRFVEDLVLFIIQAVLIAGPIVFLTYLAVEQHFGTNHILFSAFISFLVTLFFLIVFSWASDLYGEGIPEAK